MSKQLVKTISTRFLTDEEWVKAKNILQEKDHKYIGDFIAETVKEYLEKNEEK